MELLTDDRVVDERMLAQVERILHSECLRNSEILRQLLKFLAQKSASGETGRLKEYTVAIDALGKPESYDPRHDAAVRIQVGRLRQKLAEYYRTEGVGDRSFIDLPKGRFRLTCETRPAKDAESPPVAKRRVEWTLIWLAAVMWLSLLIAITWGKFPTSRASQKQTVVPSTGASTPELEQLWGPFMSSDRPLILAVEDPLFVEFQRGSGMYYRDRAINDWPALLNTPGVTGLSKSLNDPSIQPSRYYTAFGEVNTCGIL